MRTLSKLIFGFCQVMFISAAFSSLHWVLLFTMSTGTRERFDVKMQEAKRPPNRFTPMMEKMSQKTRQTRRTLKMAGMAWIRALTTTWGKRNHAQILHFQIHSFSHLHSRLSLFWWKNSFQAILEEILALYLSGRFLKQALLQTKHFITWHKSETLIFNGKRFTNVATSIATSVRARPIQCCQYLDKCYQNVIFVHVFSIRTRNVFRDICFVQFLHSRISGNTH